MIIFSVQIVAPSIVQVLKWFEGSNSWFTELVMRHQVLPWLLLWSAYAHHSLLFKSKSQQIAKIILQKCQMSLLSNILHFFATLKRLVF